MRLGGYEKKLVQDVYVKMAIGNKLWYLEV